MNRDLAAIVARDAEVRRLRTLALSIEDGGWYNVAFLLAFIDEDDGQVFPAEDAAFVAAATPAAVVALIEDRRALLALLREMREALRTVASERDHHRPDCPRWFAVSDPGAECQCCLGLHLPASLAALDTEVPA